MTLDEHIRIYEVERRIIAERFGRILFAALSPTIIALRGGAESSPPLTAR